MGSGYGAVRPRTRVQKKGAAIAIYSLNIRSVGKTTHAARTAGAHIRYITRPDAQAVMVGARMPIGRHAARCWLDRQEEADRKNARIIDKIILALPRELDRRQRRELVAAFAEKLTAGRASWLAAIHQAGKDAANPHAHLVIRDRDLETGKRVAMLSEKGACDRVRLLWEETANAALAEAAQAVRIDRRSYQARGIQKAPQRHRGPLFPRRDQFDRPGDPRLAPDSRTTEFVQHGHPFFPALALPSQPEAGQLAPHKPALSNKINLNRKIRQSIDLLHSWLNDPTKKIRWPVKFTICNTQQMSKFFDAKMLNINFQIDPETDRFIQGQRIFAGKSKHDMALDTAPIAGFGNNPAHGFGQLVTHHALGIVFGNCADVLGQKNRGLYGGQAVDIPGRDFNERGHQVAQTIRHTFGTLVGVPTQLHGRDLVPDIIGDSWPGILDQQIEDAAVLQRQFLHRADFDQLARLRKAILIGSLFNRPAH